ncbi:MAG: hypothetical protein K0U65_00110 [Gammaproteobacteria bacterium]|nr:hypothetical protein [Gammaproteobacteria bacterium]
MNNYTALIDALIKSELDGDPQHEKVIILGATPSYLQSHGQFPDLDLVILGKTVGKAFFDHGIKTPLLKRLPQILDEPKCLFRSANPDQTDSVVVLTIEVKGSAPIVVPIRQRQRIGRNGLFNVVTSVYPKEGPDPEVKWDRQGLLIWRNPGAYGR